MWNTIKQIIYTLFGKKSNKTDTEADDHRAEVAKYEDASGINMTAIIANKLATLTVTESNIKAIGDNKRAEAIDNALNAAWCDAQDITARAFGTGGVALVPYIINQKIYTDIIPKDRFFITRYQGTDILSATVIADVIRRDNNTFMRFTDYNLEGGSYVIRSRATRNDRPVDLGVLPEWVDITEEIRISGVDRILLAYLKCPANRGHTDNLYGVPITRGSEEIIDQIDECLKQVQKEYRKKDAKIFADDTLFGKDDRIDTDLFKKTAAAGGIKSGAFFEIFDPAFRDMSYYNRLNNLFALLEKSIGTSRGVLTEPQSFGATATEIKRGSADTFALISAMRKQWQQAADDLAYAFDILCNAFSICPRGDFEIKWDWDTSMVESSTESWQQLKDGQAMGVIKKAEVRQWIYPGETADEAQAVIDKIVEAEPSLQSMIGE